MRRDQIKQKGACSRAAAILFCFLALKSAAAAITSHFEVPIRGTAGARVPIRLAFRNESGALIQEVVSFQLAVTGSARFGTAPRTGSIKFGGGSPFLGGQTDGGVFEIDLDAPQAEEIDFLFEETSQLGVEPMKQLLFSDGVEPGPPRWSRETLSGPLASWARLDAPADGGGGRQGTKAWWSGAQEASKDSALVSVPLRIPRLGATFLQFFQRLQLEPGDCVSQGKVHHGALVEWEIEPGGRWQALVPSDGYPFTVATSCANGLQGQKAFGGSTQGLFQQASFDMKPLAGKRGRVRLRLATGCEACGAAEGWFADDFRIDTTQLGCKLFLPLEDDDGDGVSNETEINRGSDPETADSDGDGLGDRVEDSSGAFVSPDQPGSDPLSPDTDGGGVADGIEAALGNDPNDPKVEPLREAPDIRLAGGPGVAWVLRGDGTAGGLGQNPLEETFTGNGGFHLLTQRQAFLPAAEAFRDSRSQGSYFFGPQILGSLSVTRRIFLSPDGAFLRYLDTFENVSNKTVKEQVTLESEFAQKRWVEVEETSSGGLQWREGDDHVQFNDRDPVGGMPYLLWLYSGPAARVEPRSVALELGFAKIAFPLELLPGERKAILHFAAQGSLEANRSVAQLLATKGREVGSGLSLRDEKDIINLTLDRDGDGIPGLVEISLGLDPENPADAGLDPDGDLLTNLEEYQSSTDPHSPDTDGDGLTDGREVKELHTNPRAADSDSDGVPDGQDPFPLSALVGEFSGDRYGLAGGTALVEIQILESGKPLIGPARLTLAIEGPTAAFAAPLSGGQVLQGLGTSTVLIEAQGGPFRIGVEAQSAGRRTIKLIDSEHQGITVRASILEDFEESDGGFVAGGSTGAWEWGAPLGLPGAHSGRKVWGTGLPGSPPLNAFDTLTTPEYALADEGTPALEIFSFLQLDQPFDVAIVFASANGAEFEPLGPPLDNSNGYQRLAWQLERYAGKKVRFQFFFGTGPFSPRALGWFLDDFRLDGLKSSALIDFLEPADDPDLDGLDNKTEVARGTHPLLDDTDADGLKDNVETGTGVFVDGNNTGTKPTVPDTDQGGELDGREVKAGRNPNDPLDDEFETDFPPPLSAVAFLDGAGNDWLGLPLGVAYMPGDDRLLYLNQLQIADSTFFSDQGLVTFAKQMLVLAAEPVNNLNVTRKLFVSRTAPLLRWLEIFRSASPREELVPAFFSSGIQPSQILSTGNGDQRLDSSDDFLILKMETGNETLYLGQYFSSPQAQVRPAIVQLQGGLEAVLYSLKFPPRGRIGLLHFATFSKELAEVEAMLERIKKSDPSVLAGLKSNESPLVVNYWFDSDGDALPDSYELKNGLDPLKGDAQDDKDGDGLTNAEEFRLGTDPQKADTDGDGLGDSDELKAGSDPLIADSDGDGIPDGNDPFPLYQLAARQRELVFGIAGQETRLRVHLELSSRQPLPPVLDPSNVILALRFGQSVELLRTVAGQNLGPEGIDTFLFKPRQDWLIFDVRSPVPAEVAVTLEDRSGNGIASSLGILRFLPAEGDEDGDGFPNAFELDHGTNPLEKDSDFDGITEPFETGSGMLNPGIDQGTFPWKADSDGGGTSDKEEIAAGLNPLDAADDMKLAPLPMTMGAGVNEWVVLPSGAVTGPALGTPRADNAGVIWLNGRPLLSQRACAASLGKNRARIGPFSQSGLEVTRWIDVSPDGAFLRCADAVSNPGNTPASANLELRFDLAGDADSVVEATSSGNTALGLNDRWVLFRDKRQRQLHVFSGGEALKAIGLTSPDLFSEAFAFEVPPGQTRTLLHFLATSPQAATLKALAARLLSLQGGALEGLSIDKVETAINFPRLAPILWDRFPRSPVAPGELWSIQGEFLQPSLTVLAGGKPLEKIAVFLDRMVLRAPQEVGDARIEVRTALGESLVFEESLQVASQPGYFRRGDFDDNAKIDLADALEILQRLFLGGGAPRCLDAADTDDNGTIDLGDAIFLLHALFLGSETLPYPGGGVPGPDPTPDQLDC
jgi:hypothetical protein